MATPRSKYPSPPETREDHYPVGTEDLASLSDKNKNPKVFPDGTMEVENLKERSSDGLSYHLDTKSDKVYLAKSLDANTETQYIPTKIDKVYQTTVTLNEEIKSAYAVYKGEVKRFISKNLDRYTSSPKPLKKLIDAIYKKKNQFIFTKNRSGSQWNQIYIDTTQFGPYNYPVKLEVTKPINFINDLIVVRSGDFVSKYHRQSKSYTESPNSWGVAWVSPHRVVTHAGNGVYSLTGTRYHQTDITKTGVGGTYLSGVVTLNKAYDVTNAGQCYALSSRHIQIPTGQILSSGASYYNMRPAGGLGSSETDTTPLSQDFYFKYPEYTGNFNTGGWNGIIPSGIPFSIESWSTNPVYIGFDGEITIKPTGATDPTCTYSGDCTGSASDVDYQQSVRKAIKQAKKKFHKKINSLLVAKGVKNKGSRQKRYDRLLERVAQNAYDGLSMVRNEQIAKVQGLEANPLGGPVYYDGTISEYGGSKSTALYNTEETYKERNTKDKTTGGTGSTSSSSSGGSTY